MANGTIVPFVPRWRFRIAVVAGVMLLLLLWMVVIEPALWFFGSRDVYRSLLASRGLLTLMLMLIFALRGSWRVNGFLGGLQLKAWWMLWPVWIMALSGVPEAIVSSTATAHGRWLLLAFFVAFGEEAAFRGIILGALEPMGARRAILISSALFGLAHLGVLLAGYGWATGLVVVAFATAVGVVFAWIRMATGSIWPGLLAHGCLDYVGFAAAGGVDYHANAMNVAATIVVAGWACWLMRRRPQDWSPPSSGTLDRVMAPPLQVGGAPLQP